MRRFRFLCLLWFCTIDRGVRATGSLEQARRPSRCGAVVVSSPALLSSRYLNPSSPVLDNGSLSSLPRLAVPSIGCAPDVLALRAQKRRLLSSVYILTNISSFPARPSRGSRFQEKLLRIGEDRTTAYGQQVGGGDDSAGSKSPCRRYKTGKGAIDRGCLPSALYDPVTPHGPQ